MAKNYELEEVAGINIIATGTTLTGDIISAGDCRIDGNLKGLQPQANGVKQKK